MFPNERALTAFGLGPTMFEFRRSHKGETHASVSTFYGSCSRLSGIGFWLLDITGVTRSLRGRIEYPPRCVDSAVPPPYRTVHFQRRLQVRVVL
jgi:hypothetical protein